MEKWIILLGIINLICIVVVFYARNPVLSAFYLIFVYLVSGVLLYLYYLEFFGYIYVIVYVGAVLVLFLVIAMLTLIPVVMRIYLAEGCFFLVILSGAGLLLWLVYFGYVDCYPVLGDGGLVIGGGWVVFLDSRIVEILEFGAEVIQKLGVVLFSKYFMGVILSLLVLLVGCFVISVWWESWGRDLSRSQIKKKVVSYFKWLLFGRR